MKIDVHFAGSGRKELSRACLKWAVKGDSLVGELANDLLDIFHDQAQMVDAVSLRTRRLILDGVWKDLGRP